MINDKNDKHEFIYPKNYEKTKKNVAIIKRTRFIPNTLDVPSMCATLTVDRWRYPCVLFAHASTRP